MSLTVEQTTTALDKLEAWAEKHRFTPAIIEAIKHHHGRIENELETRGVRAQLQYLLTALTEVEVREAVATVGNIIRAHYGKVAATDEIPTVSAPGEVTTDSPPCCLAVLVNKDDVESFKERLKQPEKVHDLFSDLEEQ